MPQRPATERDRAAFSPADLIDARLGIDGDPWNLALVQRDVVWDQTRMRHLLDSLLHGYPIGAVLVCRVRGRSVVLDESRDAREAGVDEWQLLDGQQRINALVCLFTELGGYGRFYLNMTLPGERIGPLQRRQSKDKALRAIAWVADADLAPGDEPSIFERDHHIDLSRWHAWASARRAAHGAELEANDVVAVLRDIDPSFATDLTAEDAVVARNRLLALWHAWITPGIPVLRATLQSPLDVLEVFTRVNLGGVQVASTDVYFAAVKTFWPGAERRLAAVRGAASLLRSRVAALRLISRLASYGVAQGDLLPLGVERLAGEHGTGVVAAMDVLTDPDGPLLRRLERFDRWFVANTSLGHGLWQVPQQHLDEVLAWAVASPSDDDVWYAESLDRIDGYLAATTALRYRDHLGDRFHRDALREALAAAEQGQAFPAARIAAVARAGGLRGVPRLDDREARRWVAQRSARFLTTLAQRIPVAAPPIDWDHIFPQAQARRMRVVAPEGSPRRWAHHPKRRAVLQAGNLWALDLSANRSLGKKGPIEKFELLRRWADSDEGPAVFPREQWSLTDEQIAEFEAIDRLLPADDASDKREASDAAMDRFEALVDARSEWLLSLAEERYPQLRAFGADATAMEERSPAPDVAALLGIPSRLSRVAATSHRDAAAARWEPRRREFEIAVDRVSKHLRRGRRVKRVRDPDGFEASRSIRVCRPHSETHLAFGFSYVRESSSGTPFWACVESTIGDWETQESRLTASALADQMQREVTSGPDGEVTRLWFPLDVDLALAGVPLRLALLAAAGRIVDVMDGAAA